MENGWGYVIHYRGHTRFAAGCVPPWLIRHFCSRKAYIYFLEVLAQLIAFLACRHLDSNLLISFIDNSSGFFALKKDEKGILQGWSHLQPDSSHLEDHLQDGVASPPRMGGLATQHQRQGLQTVLRRNASDPSWSRPSPNRRLVQNTEEGGHRPRLYIWLGTAGHLGHSTSQPSER